MLGEVMDVSRGLHGILAVQELNPCTYFVVLQTVTQCNGE